MGRTPRLALLSLTLLVAGCSFDSAKTSAVRTIASMIFSRATAQSFASEAPAALEGTAAPVKPASRLCALRCKLKGSRKVTRTRTQTTVVSEVHLWIAPRRNENV